MVLPNGYVLRAGGDLGEGAQPPEKGRRPGENTSVLSNLKLNTRACTQEVNGILHGHWAMVPA